MGLISDIAGQAADVARSQGELAGSKAAKDPTSLEEARQQLAAEGKVVTDAAVQERAYNNASSFYGTGGAVQRGIQAATGALTVLAGGGDLAGALAAASAPELANIIGHRSGLSDNDALIAHALLGGVVASLQGKSAAAGAAGALSGEIAARAIKDQLFPGKDNSDLNEADKQLISNLATLASGLAGNIVSGNASGTTAGAQAGKNAAENNALGCSPITCVNSLGDDLTRGGGMGGGTAGGAAGVGIVAIIAEMFGGDDKSTVSDTGGDQIVDQVPTNTGGDQTETGNVPTDTGNNQSLGQGATNTGNPDGNPDTGGNTTTMPIAEQNKDDLAYLALRGKEAEAAAKNLGFGKPIPRQKAPFDSNGQTVYSNGKTFITPDIDSHNVTNGWKMFNRKGQRIGTYDSNLNRIKD